MRRVCKSHSFVRRVRICPVPKIITWRLLPSSCFKICLVLGCFYLTNRYWGFLLTLEQFVELIFVCFFFGQPFTFSLFLLFFKVFVTSWKEFLQSQIVLRFNVTSKVLWIFFIIQVENCSNISSCIFIFLKYHKT